MGNAIVLPIQSSWISISRTKNSYGFSKLSLYLCKDIRHSTAVLIKDYSNKTPKQIKSEHRDTTSDHISQDG